MKISREKMDELAGFYQFKLSEEDKDELELDFIQLTDGLEALAKIDTEGVEPMVYPFENETIYMREDDLIEQLTVEEVLKNAPKTKHTYFSVSKVVE